MIVDAHHHLWDPGARRHAWLDALPQLRRPFGIGEFSQLTAENSVTASVLVQVLAAGPETEEFLALAAATPLLAGVVGWADLTDPGIGDELARFRQLPGGDRLVGIRHLIQDEPDPGWLGRPDVRRGLRAVGDAGLAYDLLIRPGQLPAAIAAVRDLGNVRFVLDHEAKPDIAHGQREPWSSLIGELAAAPNVSCKLSGLVTEAGPDWAPAQITPYANRLLDCFGPGRLMFGSDWPVCTLVASYGDVLRLAVTALAGRLSQAEMTGVLAGNAAQVYGLRLPRPDLQNRGQPLLDAGDVHGGP
jgi:L-fuconolactonase